MAAKAQACGCTCAIHIWEKGKKKKKHRFSVLIWSHANSSPAGDVFVEILFMIENYVRGFTLGPSEWVHTTI